MSILAETFRAQVRKSKDPFSSKEVSFAVGYPTTLLPLDYLNGMTIENDVIGDDIVYSHQSIGLGEGSINSLIGKAGTAKSTFAAQIGLSIISPFKNSVLIYDDVEGGMSLQRMKNISGWSIKKICERVILRNVGISAESFYERVSMHCDQKIETAISNPGIMNYWTGYYDQYGEKLFQLIPTVYILDSLALLVPKDIGKKEELGGNMDTTAAARKNAQIFRTLAPKLKAANVILLVVNHINSKVSTSIIPQAAQINYLGQDETVPGGFMALYLSNNIFKFTASTKLKDDSGFGINGFMSKIKLVKSRSNRAGREVQLVYDQSHGFDRLYSNFQLLKECGMVKGGGKSFYIEGCEHIKFSQKGLYDKFYSSEEFREHMKIKVLECCNMMIPKYDEKNSAELTRSELASRLVEAFEDDDEIYR